MEPIDDAAALRPVHMNMEQPLDEVDQGEYDPLKPVIRKANSEERGI